MELICVIQFCRTSSLGAWHTNISWDPGVLSLNANLSLSSPAFSSNSMLFTYNSTTSPTSHVKSSRPTWSRGQNFRFVASGRGLVLMQCWPRSHTGCPRGLVVCQSLKSRASSTLRSSLIGNCCLLYNILVKLTFESCIDTVVTAILLLVITGCDFLVAIKFMLERKRSYTVF